MSEVPASAAADSAAVPRLAELTTMRVGGPAERLVIARTRDELVQHALELWGEGQPWLLLGGGSNTVVSDEGYPGAVLLVRTGGVDRVSVDRAESAAGGSTGGSTSGSGSANGSTGERVRLRVQAGQDWDRLVEYCVSQGLAGIEALSGIPGLAGAAPVQNIGAYGAELSDVLHSIEFLDAESGEVHRLSAEQLELGYRTSTLKRGLEGVVLSLDLVLAASPDGLSAPIRYNQLANALEVELGERVPLAELRAAVLQLRASKGMVLNDEDHDTWSAGSFFTNPIVTERFALDLPESAPRYAVEGGNAPAPVVVTFEQLQRGEIPANPTLNRADEPRRVKLSAAWLIEHAGIEKGFRLPGSGAAISSKHTLALTNRGGASASDVAQLARFVVQRVQQEFGVILVPEPNLYGLEL